MRIPHLMAGMLQPGSLSLSFPIKPEKEAEGLAVVQGSAVA